MIATLNGKILRRNPPSLILEVNNIGYEIFLPFQTFTQISEEENVFLEILQIKKEDADLLYGFLSEEEKDFFKTLIKIKGVGDKMVLQMLNKISILELKNLIINEDLNGLKKLPGLGPKTASRLLLELKGKIINDNKKPSCWEDASLALQSLGFDKKSAENSLEKVYEENDSVENLIRKVLEMK